MNLFHSLLYYATVWLFWASIALLEIVLLALAWKITWALMREAMKKLAKVWMETSSVGLIGKVREK